MRVSGPYARQADGMREAERSGVEWMMSAERVPVERAKRAAQAPTVGERETMRMRERVRACVRGRGGYQ